MESVRMKIRVRYAETDQMGIVHHSNYFVWFEAGRSEICRTWGIPYPQWEEQGLFLPLVDAHCRYKAPLRYDEEAELEVKVQKLKRHSVTFSYRLFNDQGRLAAEGTTEHAFAGPQGRLIRGGHPLIGRLEEILAGAKDQEA